MRESLQESGQSKSPPEGCSYRSQGIWSSMWLLWQAVQANWRFKEPCGTCASQATQTKLNPNEFLFWGFHLYFRSVRLVNQSHTCLFLFHLASLSLWRGLPVLLVVDWNLHYSVLAILQYGLNCRCFPFDLIWFSEDQTRAILGFVKNSFTAASKRWNC